MQDEHDEVNPLGEQLSGALPAMGGDATWYTVSGNSSEIDSLRAPSGVFAPLSQATSTQPALSGVPVTSLPTGRPDTQVKKRAKSRGPRVRLIVIAIVALIVLGAYAFSAFAAPAMHRITTNQGQAQTSTQPGSPGGIPRGGTATAKPFPTPNAQPSPTPTPVLPATSSWFPQHLPASCSTAGVTVLQAEKANDEAVAFTQREEYISFEDPGSLTSSTNLMTNNAKKLRFVNDKRSTQAFAQELTNGPDNKGLIQVPGNLQPQVIQCQQQNGNVFAWVVVSFSLVVQCQTDNQGNPCAPNPQGLPEMDPQTHQVKVHTMAVLLLAIPPGTPNPPLSLGWAVSDYMLDQTPNLPTIPAQP